MDTLELIKNLLDQERRSRGNITWAALAAELNVHPVTLWKWRHGRELGSAAEALLPLAVKHLTAAAPADAITTN
jgi:transposase-like protein